MNIVVLAGGLSPERNVSLTSGSLISAALRRKGHKVLMLDVYEGLSDVPMCEVQEYFSPDLFIRIQRSYIINLEHVSRYIGNFVRMIDDRDITIGRDYQETIRKSFILIGSRKRVVEKRKQKYGG